MVAKHSAGFTPEIGEGAIGTHSHVRRQDLRQLLRLPLDGLIHPDRETARLLAETGAVTFGRVAAQLQSGCEADLKKFDEWLLPWRLTEEANSMLLRMISERFGSPYRGTYAFGSLQGIWVEEFARAAVGTLPEKKQGQLSGWEDEAILQEISGVVIWLCKRPEKAGIRDTQGLTALMLERRFLYDREYVLRNLGWDSGTYETRTGPILRTFGEAIYRNVMKMRENQAQVRKKIARGGDIWYLSLLRDLYPELDEGFFRSFAPPWGLRGHEQIIVAIVRSVFWDLPGDGELLLAPYRGSTLGAACDSLVLRIWEGEEVAEEARERLRQTHLMNLMTRGLGCSSTFLLQNLQREWKGDLISVPVSLLFTDSDLVCSLERIFNTTTAKGLSTLLFPEQRFQDAIFRTFGEAFLTGVRAVMYLCGLGESMEDAASDPERDRLAIMLSVYRMAEICDREDTPLKVIPFITDVQESIVTDAVSLILGWEGDMLLSRQDLDFLVVDGYYQLPYQVMGQMLGWSDSRLYAKRLKELANRLAGELVRCQREREPEVQNRRFF